MNVITKKAWQKYIDTLNAINKKAADDVKAWVKRFGTDENGVIYGNILEAVDNFDGDIIQACYAIADKYGNASAAVAAQMYDATAELEGAIVPDATMADIATYGDVAKTVYGVLKTSQNIEELAGAVSRLVKKAGCDTTLQNAYRDRAQYAWIPTGDTCAFCIALAANGWVNIGDRTIKKGMKHAEHIHSNCDCTYAVRFNENTKVDGYNPQKYLDMLNKAAEKEGLLIDSEDVQTQFIGGGQNMNEEVINAMRRQNYAKNKEKINAQKRSAYEKRKELNSSKSEEINVGG